MAGPSKEKFELDGARVYVHRQNGPTVTHLDVEHPALNAVIEPGENTFVGGKAGGVFIGLKGEMIERAERLIDRLDQAD